MSQSESYTIMKLFILIWCYTSIIKNICQPWNMRIVCTRPWFYVSVSFPDCASGELTQTEAMFYITIVLGVWAAVQCVIYFCLSCGLVSCDFNTKYNVFEKNDVKKILRRFWT